MNGELTTSRIVFVLEGPDARSLTQKDTPEKVVGLVADVKLIGLKPALQPVLGLVRSGGWLTARVKSQFGRENVGKGGIVRDRDARNRALRAIVDWLGAQAGSSVIGSLECPVLGGDGHREYFVAARKS